MAQNGEDGIFAATLKPKSRAKREILTILRLLRNLGGDRRTNMNAALSRHIKVGELDLYHRLAMSPMRCIRLSFGRSGVERGAANV
jgi:hypothetical protein